MRNLVLAFLGLLLAVGCRSTGPASVEARPYELVFEGNRSLSSHKLTEMIQLDLRDFERAGFKKAYIDDAAYDLEIGYQAIGFPFAIVSYSIEGGSPPQAPERVHFTVTEGPRTVLDSAQFDGMHQLTQANFEKALSSKRTPLLQNARPYYVERDILNALSAMQGQYIELGYLDAELTLKSTDFSEDRGSARITVQVEEGPRSHVGEVKVLSADAPADVLGACQALVDETLADSERVFRQRTGYELRGQVIEALATRGYADADVDLTQEQRPDSAVVDITLEIVAGQQIRITKVRFPEDVKTREAFLRSRMRLTEGDTYDSEKVRESVRRLYETGLFTRVSVDLEQGESEERTLIVGLKEARSGEVYIEPGYGSYERARISVGYRKRNLWGTGRLLRIESTFAELAQRASVTLTDPWFLGSELSADLSLRYDRRKLPSFTEEDLGAGIFWTKEWNVEHATTFGYQYRLSRATDILILDEAVQEAQNNLNISSIQVAQRMDSRDNFFLPSKGWFNEAAAELGDGALGSELDFLRTSARTSTYVRVLPRTVLAGALRTGLIFPIGSTDSIPLQERYFNGGQNSVRSFRFDELGPKDADGNPLGGETFSTANIELRQDLTSRFQGAAFVDAGNVTLTTEEYFDFPDVEFGIGAGLRYLLPIGPVRVDVAWNPDPGPQDSEYVVQFSVGMAF